MSVPQSDIDLLEEFLDGSLPVAEAEHVRRRLDNEPKLEAVLDSLIAEREVRQQVFASLEPSENAAADLAAKIVGASRRFEHHRRVLRGLKLITAAAACITIGFASGWMGRGSHNPAMPGMQPVGGPIAQGDNSGKIKWIEGTPYRVGFTDATGRVVAWQNFNSPDEARQFANDLANSQDRRRQVNNAGLVVPVLNEQY